jgi:hypothetical protein
MEEISDLSFSGLVNVIQNDKSKAGDVLYSCATKLEGVRVMIKDLENQLNSLKTHEGQLLSVPEKISQHIKIDFPLAVIRDGFIVVASKDNLTIERNVI